jgi:hypothetical protein
VPYFSTLSGKWHDFVEKNLLNKNVCLIFLQRLYETFLILRRIQRGIVIYIYIYIYIYMTGRHVKYPLFSSGLKFEFSGQIFEKFSNIKFYENPSSGSRVVACGRSDRRADRHVEANSRFSQLCERA